MPIYQPKNILITGGAGFIGANFVRFLLGQDLNIHLVNLDLLTYAGSLENLVDLPHAEKHQFVQGDICDKALLAKIFIEHCIDTVVHFAAESHVDRSISDPGQFIQTNIMGTFTLLETARHFWLEEQKLTPQQCRFHHISTDEVYGSLNSADPPFTETTAYAPHSPYSASKASSDHLVQAYYHTYGLPITISNCSNNYGPYQHPEKLIPTIILNCKNNKKIPVYGDGKNIRDWLYVDDHCAAICTILQNGKVGDVYNIGGNNEQSNINIVRQICHVMDQHHPENAPHARLITFITDRKGHDWRYAINNAKIKTTLRWEPKQDFMQGIAKTIEFYLN